MSKELNTFDIAFCIYQNTDPALTLFDERKIAKLLNIDIDKFSIFVESNKKEIMACWHILKTDPKETLTLFRREDERYIKDSSFRKQEYNNSYITEEVNLKELYKNL